MKIREDVEETAMLKRVKNMRTAGRASPDQVVSLAALVRMNYRTNRWCCSSAILVMLSYRL